MLATNEVKSKNQLKTIYKTAPAGSAEESQAFADWLVLCSTPAEASEAFLITSHPERRKNAFKRWLELCQTPDQAHEAYNASSNHDLERLASIRMKELGGYKWV